MNWVKEYTEKYEADTIANRRYLHRHPEIGFTEIQTSDYVAKKLEEYGLEVQRGFGKVETGVMGVLRGNGEKVLNLRADIDALEIHEENQVEYRSENEKNMHACGHDGHTAMLLAAARILAENRDKVHGIVKFVFQPAEEGPYPGGACSVLESGVLDDVDGAFAMHVCPDLPVGQVNLHRGAGTASADMFTIEVIGKGGHGSDPAKAIDPIIMATEVISAFQPIISRNTDARDASVLSVCTIKGGEAGNAIPDKVTLTGTLRNFDENVRNMVVERMEAVLTGVATMNGGKYTFQINRGYPTLINDDGMVDLADCVCMKLFEAKNVHILNKPVMGGEDFAYVANKIPAAFLWLGCANENEGINKPLHNPEFQLDERCLIKGTELFIQFTLEFFNHYTI